MKKILFLVTLFNISASLLAQEGQINTCTQVFVDPGREGNYAPNLHEIWTYCPDLANPQGNQITFTFFGDGFGLGSGDTLFVYDGTDTTANLITFYVGGGPGVDFGVIPGAGNNSGCLTFVFTSDDVEEGPGWVAQTSCNTVCQPIIPTVVTQPPVVPADTGFIDICQGDTVFFSATADYPLQGGYYFPQADSTSSFSWTFGDGTADSGQEVWHVYESQGGFLAYLIVGNTVIVGNDTLFCQNTETSITIIRVSTTPIFSGTGVFNNPLCLNGPANLVGQATPVTDDFGASGALADSTFLPDGTGVSYTTSINLSNVAPGTTLDNIDDLLAICLNMEHTYMGDLDMSILCPNGSSMVLFSQGGGGTILGNAHGVGLPVDSDTPNTVEPGDGFEYCFSPTSTNGSIHDADNWETIPVYTDPYGNVSNNISQLMEGTYEAEGDWTNLLGCPLDGIWTITVTDNLALDNGWIFSWGLELSSNVLPFTGEFTPIIVDFNWLDDPTITGVINDSTVSIIGAEVGFHDYTLVVTDDFGCSYDTTIQAEIIPPPVIFALDSGCVATDLQLIVNGSQQGGIWSYIPPSNGANVTINDVNSTSPIVSSDEEGLVQFVFEDELCLTSDTLNELFHPLPKIKIVPDDYRVCWGDTINIFSESSGTVVTYLWQSDQELPDQDLTKPSAYTLGAKNQIMEVTASGFCGDASDAILVEPVPCYVEAPNVITPNNDGINDGFVVRWLEFFPGSQLVIYDRWGIQVYQSDDYQNGNPWKAENQDDGVYFYVLTLSDRPPRLILPGQPQNVTGYITVISEGKN